MYAERILRYKMEKYLHRQSHARNQFDLFNFPKGPYVKINFCKIRTPDLGAWGWANTYRPDDHRKSDITMIMAAFRLQYLSLAELEAFKKCLSEIKDWTVSDSDTLSEMEIEPNQRFLESHSVFGIQLIRNHTFTCCCARYRFRYFLQSGTHKIGREQSHHWETLNKESSIPKVFKSFLVQFVPKFLKPWQRRRWTQFHWTRPDNLIFRN
jgi:hypothetical protein